MRTSAGLVLLKENRTKVLLAHPSRSERTKSHQFPKGGIEANESELDAAIRETMEETSIVVPRELIDLKSKRIIEYKNKTELYKTVVYFVADVSSLNLPDIIPTEWLQFDEMDYAAFYTFEFASKIIFHRHKPILQHLN